MAKNDICTTQVSFLIGQRLSQGYFLAYKNLLHQTHDLAALAPPVAGGTDIIQPAKGRGEFFYLGQGALAGRLTRAIDIKDHPCVSCSIHQTPDFPGWRLIRERAAEQIIEKERAQGFDWRLGQRCQKAREGRAGWQPVTLPPRP